MDLGMPTLIETASLEECARLCRALRLQFIELNMNMPQYQLDVFDPEAARALAAQYGIYYTLHLDENLNVCDFNPHIAQGYMQTVKESIELAKQLHMPVLNMHLSTGVYFTLPQERIYLYAVYRERYMARMRAFRDMCEAAIGAAPIRICIENCDGYLDFQREAIALLLESPVFGLTYDVGHDHACGGKDGPFILANQARLCHMHLHDAAGKKNHLALGTGDMDVGRFLRLADSCSCRVVLETKTIEGLCQSARWVQENG